MLRRVFVAALDTSLPSIMFCQSGSSTVYNKTPPEMELVHTNNWNQYTDPTRANMNALASRPTLSVCESYDTGPWG